jgi:hypothetical protein
VQAVF